MNFRVQALGLIGFWRRLASGRVSSGLVRTRRLVGSEGLRLRFKLLASCLKASTTFLRSHVMLGLVGFGPCRLHSLRRNETYCEIARDLSGWGGEFNKA